MLDEMAKTWIWFAYAATFNRFLVRVIQHVCHNFLGCLVNKRHVEGTGNNTTPDDCLDIWIWYDMYQYDTMNRIISY